jgi:signal transduction histidine kinase
VRVVLTAVPGQVRLEVEDDGIGIPSAKPARGIGLTGIGERVRALGGDMAIRAGAGTQLVVRIPLPGEASARAA